MFRHPLHCARVNKSILVFHDGTDVFILVVCDENRHGVVLDLISSDVQRNLITVPVQQTNNVHPGVSLVKFEGPVRLFVVFCRNNHQTAFGGIFRIRSEFMVFEAAIQVIRPDRGLPANLDKLLHKSL